MTANVVFATLVIIGGIASFAESSHYTGQKVPGVAGNVFIKGITNRIGSPETSHARKPSASGIYILRKKPLHVDRPQIITSKLSRPEGQLGYKRRLPSPFPPQSDWTPLGGSHDHDHERDLTISCDENTAIETDDYRRSGLQGKFQSNIELPKNPFVQSYSSFGDNMSPEADPMISERNLQNLLNSYMDEMYTSNKKTYPPPTQDVIQPKADFPFDPQRHDPKVGNSNGDEFSPSAIASLFNSGQESNENRRSDPGHFPPVSSDQFQKPFAKTALQMKDLLPPAGSYKPYGERTIIMVKYPQFYQSSQPSGKLNNMGIFGTVFNHHLPLPKDKSADFGVIISQNYVFQPLKQAQPDWNPYFQGLKNDQQDSSRENPGNLVAQLAKALAMRNKVANAYSTSAQFQGNYIEKQAPFVLVHLESFTKKSNMSSRFGFDNIREKNYHNGTIIYPSKADPGMLASTRFEFDNVQDVEHLFDRPLGGIFQGETQPIPPLGRQDIEQFLKLLYEVHTNIHDGGKGKVEALRGLSISLERKSLPGSRPLSDLERQRLFSGESSDDHWMHSSTIGVRALGGNYEEPPPKYSILG